MLAYPNRDITGPMFVLMQQSSLRCNELINLPLVVVMSLLLISSNLFAASPVVPVKLFLYHHQPPFITGDLNYPDSGLIFDLAMLLRQQRGAPQVSVEIRPRPRLNWELRKWLSGDCPHKEHRCDSDWMLFGVIPEWGWQTEREQTFNWVTLFNDADLIVSSQQKPVQYDRPSTLRGLVFAGLRGHQYPGVLGEMIQKHQLTRDDGSSNLAVLQRVAKGRADVTLVRRSTLNYLISNSSNGLTDKLYISEPAYNRFTLKVMLPGNRPDLREWLIATLNTESWQQRLKKYGISR